MREALAARSERDFISAAPAPRRARPSATKAGAIWLRLTLVVRRRPGAVVGGLAVAAAASAVALNALTFQTGRHPAPLFAPKSGPVGAPAPLPPVRPAPAPVAPPPAPAAPARDPIGEMIRAGDGPSNSPAGPRRKPIRTGRLQRRSAR